ncbi:amino acid adenylation domain-containing protein [Streptomyces sp. NPDC057654]|uniref:non-ribosomal peptide synthetase n=1 Tax=Streptomyces sp. NPDC057654 TaxID=3346196 RepID=UPI0036B5D790
MTGNASQGAPTSAPRWTEHGAPADGAGEHRGRIPEELAADLRRTAARLGTDLATLLLAAHARVLATVTAEHELNTGQVRTADAAPTALRLTVADSTWAELVQSVRVSEPGETGRTTEIVCDLAALEAPSPRDALGDGVLLRVVFTPDGAGLSLRVLFDRATLNEEYAARLTGYHLTALRLLAADPGARHHRQSLLSPAETEIQLHGLSGPRTGPLEQTFTDLFEEQVRGGPDRIAAAHGADRWTYGELNARANQYAHALLAAGAKAEDVVAVVMHRGLDWIAAALGVFKAGGVYLPVHPDFPAERTAGQLDRSECALVLAEPSAEARVREAAAGLDRPPRILITSQVSQGSGKSDENPGIAVAPGQAAYIYFTSGSTGAPKGALCEHAGLLNHLHMKIEDMGMAAGGGEVSAQTAAQFVDISLWQFAAPLLVGGSTRVVDTDTLLDVDRFLDEIVRGAVTVAQVVPSYLEVLLAHVERHPRPLGGLRALSVTGETLRLESVRRWFRAYPHIRLVNSYGATEVSDDTMHEVLDRAPQGDFVSVGRALRNVDAYVLDENLALAPLGSPGEIAFSGVCVGRGYINDEERTRQAFVPDPFRADTRMYRTGDFGRRLPDGRIEYLGRRDEQVKIRGFRIEIGEIENRLLAMADVRDAAVVIEGAPGGPRNLVAFFTGGEELVAEHLRDFLAGSLPDYMVPTYFHRLRRLPLTENGKVDKTALLRLAGTLGHGGAPYVAPRTPTEQRLATLWAEVLNAPLERIGRDDDFFELGGSSLAGVRLVVRMDRELSLKQLVGHPVLSSLAAVLDGTHPEGPSADGLLQPLSRVDAAHHSLVCFPYAGGNAVNFRALAAELERDGIAVYGVEPPGHDLADDGEPLADVAEVARRVHAEIVARVGTPVLLWGHGEGAAAALETARLLEADGRRAERVFIGALLLDEVDDLRREMRTVADADNRTLLARLRSESAYVELDGLKPERAEVVGSAYRHDVLTAHHHLIAVRQNAERYGITSAVDVVVAQDDATTSGFGERHGEWKLVADTVRLRELAQGGRYFVRASPADSAALVRAACERPRRTTV